MSMSKHQVRSLIRKVGRRAHDPSDDVRHLNIMAMMDIMTILLVAFIMMAAQSAEISIGAVELPTSRSNEQMPEKAVTLMITRDVVTVDGQAILAVKNGAFDASEKQNGALGMVVPKLSQFLGRVRRANEDDLRARGKELPERPEVLIIADRATPYRLLLEVLTSSRTTEAGFRRFRLIVVEDQP
jgi:biopolymer transport protein ExbD